MLAVSALLGAIFIDKRIIFIQPAKGRIIPHCSRPALILMVHAAKSAAKTNTSDNRQLVEQVLALLVALTTAEPKNNTVA